MSAFVVSKAHIDGMIAAGLNASRYGNLSWYHDGERHELTLQNASEVGAMIWAENVASVEHRYSPPGREAIYGEGFGGFDTGSELPGTYQLELIAPGVEPIETPEWTSEYRFPLMRSGRPLTPVEALKAIDCYEYQSCEHDDWQTSEAFAFCDSLRRSLIGCLPGYDDAKWGLSS